LVTILYRKPLISREPPNSPSRSSCEYIFGNGILVLDRSRINVRQKPLGQSVFSYRIVITLPPIRLMSRVKVYDNTLAPYNVSRIMTKDATLDLEAYKNYSPLLQGPRIALAYALSFASISCVVVHAALYDGKDLVRRLYHVADPAEDDIHMRQMRKYPEVPEWWYQVLFVITFGIALGGVIGFPTFLPWWGFILTMVLPIVFILPIGMIEARTSMQIGLNVITEFIAGYIWPGKPVANTLVKIYGYMAMSKGLAFVGDLKLGVYMKIPPRAMFRFQILGTMIANFTALGLRS
jgi:OPT family oligopeptide transporter